MARSAFELDRLADLIADELQRQTGGRGRAASGATAAHHDGHHDCATGECGADCDGAHCVAHCPDKVRRLVECGVERVSAGPGVGACDNVLARMIDHTLLAPTATRSEVEALCDEARENCFASVCVNPYWVTLANEKLAESPVRVCTVIGFPLGANRPETKVYEAIRAVEDGAVELDMVLNSGALRSGDYTAAERDIAGVVEAGRGRAIVKVILETGHLTDEEKVKACVLARRAGAHFVKTSTGFGKGGATEEDVRLMRRVVGPKLGVKASGGVKDQPTAIRMIEAGATRIGASAGVRIVHGNGASPERAYGAEAPAAPPAGSSTAPAIRSTVIPAPRATIHRLR
jgi:deoxyribose-phosphate aldolase